MLYIRDFINCQECKKIAKAEIHFVKVSNRTKATQPKYVEMLLIRHDFFIFLVQIHFL